MRDPFERPPLIGPVIILAIGAMFMVFVFGAGLVWLFNRADSGVQTSRCTISKAGEDYRESEFVDLEHLPDGLSGDEYDSDSGCLNVDVGPPVTP